MRKTNLKGRLLLFITIICVAIFLGGCTEGTYSSTSTIVTVLEKGHSEDLTDAWIIISNPEQNEERKIIVEEVMVWNLIEEDKDYFISFIEENKEFSLSQISYPGDEESLR